MSKIAKISENYQKKKKNLSDGYFKKLLGIYKTEASKVDCYRSSIKDLIKEKTVSEKTIAEATSAMAKINNKEVN